MTRRTTLQEFCWSATSLGGFRYNGCEIICRFTLATTHSIRIMMMKMSLASTAVTLLSAAMCCTLPADAAAETRDSITQYGITWTFAEPVQAGRFVTGDWWVVGPVTIKSVTPTPTVDRHGSVVNPPAGDTQGYDARIAGFDASLRAQFPLRLEAGPVAGQHGKRGCDRREDARYGSRPVLPRPAAHGRRPDLPGETAACGCLSTGLCGHVEGAVHRVATETRRPASLEGSRQRAGRCRFTNAIWNGSGWTTCGSG